MRDGGVRVMTYWISYGDGDEGDEAWWSRLLLERNDRREEKRENSENGHVMVINNKKRCRENGDENVYSGR